MSRKRHSIKIRALYADKKVILIFSYTLNVDIQVLHDSLPDLGKQSKLAYHTSVSTMPVPISGATGLCLRYLLFALTECIALHVHVAAANHITDGYSRHCTLLYQLCLST